MKRRRGGQVTVSPANGQFTFAQSIQHPQLFRDGPRRQFAAEGAFAFKNFLEIRAHGESRKSFSFFCILTSSLSPYEHLVEFIKQR